jgi:hypothetical protein
VPYYCLQDWAAVCSLDSDGDGLTNGQELGDPTCTWKVGDPSPNGTNLSHPGQWKTISGYSYQKKDTKEFEVCYEVYFL